MTEPDARRRTAAGDRHREPHGLTPFEIIAGIPHGNDRNAPELPTPCGGSPLAAIDDAILPALQRPPCVVSFSGGRDSSAVLAVATRLARQQGLAPPVPVTLRFPDAPASYESSWQERVIGFLGLREWTRIELTDEVDYVGPVAAAVLRKHGVIWPPNTHFHRPILEMARGGSLLTGVDGDGLFGTWRYLRVMRLLRGAVTPEPRDVLRLLQAAAPPAVRKAVNNCRQAEMAPWLRPEMARAIARCWIADRSREPVTWQSRVRWFAGLRYLRLVLHSLDLMAAETDVLLVNPLVSGQFLAELGAARKRFGYGGRTAIMAAIFGDELPADIITRRTKTHFSDAFTHRHSRSFARTWTGRGVDDQLVDPDLLRAAWLSSEPPFLSALLLQRAWLASQEPGPEIRSDDLKRGGVGHER